MVVIFFRPHFRLKSISDSVVLSHGIGVYYIALKGGVCIGSFRYEYRVLSTSR